MKLTLMLGVLTVLLLCVVEETSAHAGNPSADTSFKHDQQVDGRKDRKKQRIAAKKAAKANGEK